MPDHELLFLHAKEKETVMRWFFVLLIGSVLTTLSGYDFKTKSGKSYQGAGIGKITSAGMQILLPSGIEVIPLEDVPDELIGKLSEKRKKRFFAALKEYRSAPPEVKDQEKKKRESQERMIETGWQLHRNLQAWLRSFSVARSPSREACLFATMARSFVREFPSAKSDAERADLVVIFLKKVNDANLAGGEIKLDIPKPSMPQHGTPRPNYPINPPRGARSYKVNGKRISR